MTTLLEKKELIQAIGAGQLTERRYANLETKASWKMNHGERISALANRSDAEVSWLLIGIGDDGALCSRDENWVKNQEEIVSQHLNEYLNPSICVKTPECFEINGSWIIVLEILQPGVVVD